MAIQTRLIEYADSERPYEGLLTWDDAIAVSRPGILVAHTIRGRTAFEESKARDLAALGYAAFALDVYGQSELGKDEANQRAQMQGLLADRGALLARLSLSLHTLRNQPEVDEQRVAAIGFCFGGLCVLDLARSGENLAGVTSFHGLLTPPAKASGKPVKAKVLVLHGWDDPMATPESVIALADELTAAPADWQLHAYGNTVHAFTNPAAADTDRGTVYNAAADRRSWAAMTQFLHELFSG